MQGQLLGLLLTPGELIPEGPEPESRMSSLAFQVLVGDLDIRVGLDLGDDDLAHVVRVGLNSVPLVLGNALVDQVDEPSVATVTGALETQFGLVASVATAAGEAPDDGDQPNDGDPPDEHGEPIPTTGERGVVVKVVKVVSEHLLRSFWTGVFGLFLSSKITSSWAPDP